MLPDAFGENSGANGAKTRIISSGRVRTLRPPLFERRLVTSVPYPLRSRMAKVELEGEFCELRLYGVLRSC
jgi:hypothetical protein